LIVDAEIESTAGPPKNDPGWQEVKTRRIAELKIRHEEQTEKLGSSREEKI
jgi:hypothetical protein